MKVRVSTAFLAAAMAAVLSSPASAKTDESGPDFDQGVNASELLTQAKNAAAQDATVVPPAQVGAQRYEQSCVVFTFHPDDKPVSDVVQLRSTEWATECQNYPAPSIPMPRGRQVPGPKGQYCWERPIFTHVAGVRITLRDRQALLPWEYDQFKACLLGPRLQLHALAAAYDYKLVQGNSHDGDFVLVPVKKISMKPDPDGIAAQDFSKTLALTLKDQWASYYAGEQTVLRLVLKKHLPHWFDTTILEKEISLPAAEIYAVNFLDYAGEFSEKLEAGEKYYVEYSFRRIGTISTPDLMKGDKTGRVAYEPAAPAA